eukprot:6337836-Ditylum_brightwellii.AAC.1
MENCVQKVAIDMCLNGLNLTLGDVTSQKEERDDLEQGINRERMGEIELRISEQDRAKDDSSS